MEKLHIRSDTIPPDPSWTTQPVSTGIVYPLTQSMSSLHSTSPNHLYPKHLNLFFLMSSRSQPVTGGSRTHFKIVDSVWLGLQHAEFA